MRKQKVNRSMNKKDQVKVRFYRYECLKGASSERKLFGEILLPH